VEAHRGVAEDSAVVTPLILGADAPRSVGRIWTETLSDGTWRPCWAYNDEGGWRQGEAGRHVIHCCSLMRPATASAHGCRRHPSQGLLSPPLLVVLGRGRAH
jgi:hypothetical protein